MPTVFENPGHAPSRWPKDTRIRVTFTGGHISKHLHKVSELRWTKTGSDFDIATFWRAGE